MTGAETSPTGGFSRREAFAAGAIVAVGVAASGSTVQAETEASPPSLTAAKSRLFPTVETNAGRVRGLERGGIKSFRGIPYGADTGGKNRFLPPQPVTPWRGIRDALEFGPIAPQVLVGRPSDYSRLSSGLASARMSEDCLTLNVWTPSLERNARMPVIVHLHGGGFYGGSSNSVGYDGENLARYGDVVVVTVNHRLGPLGYVFLGDAGFPDAYGQSSGAGLLDLVEALRWVKTNIAAFGGDESRVLVFGQSGGSGKTSVLLAMPAAKGLFHRAGMMSGFRVTAIARQDAAKTADGLLRTLEVQRGDLRTLQARSLFDIVAAQSSLEDAFRARGEAPSTFDAVVDGTVVPHDPFDPAAPAVSKNVPIMVSTCLDERAYRTTNFSLDEAGLRAFMTARAGARADEAMALYRDANPGSTPYIRQVQLETDLLYRRSANAIAERKAVQGGAAVWTYLWTMPSPAYGGRYGAPHATDLGPSLRNLSNGLNGATPDFLRLSDQISSAWINFAAHGDPGNPHLPAWAPFDARSRTTMVFSAEAHAENDPRGAIRRFWADSPIRAAEGA
jgi:para-nitrobenzyl esterase